MTIVDHDDEDSAWLMRSLARERHFSRACGGSNVVPIVATVTAPLFGQGDAHDALACVCEQFAGSSTQPLTEAKGNATGQAYFSFMPLAEYGVLLRCKDCGAAGNVGTPTADRLPVLCAARDHLPAAQCWVVCKQRSFVGQLASGTAGSTGHQRVALLVRP